MDKGAYRLTKSAKIMGLQLIVCIIGLFLGFFWGAYDKNKHWDKLIYPGIKVASIDLGGKTKEEGKKLIESQLLSL